MDEDQEALKRLLLQMQSIKLLGKDIPCELYTRLEVLYRKVYGEYSSETCARD